ncbi:MULTISPECIES: rhodanese-like domain-containing protein [unclassified Anabaena]|uniref:rhodanese-like domain-containing protein n=1 Tax=unclassified Anabaena TaxID=2619674 RepID=UPI001446D023|nr:MULTISPECIES: rhodanese-like domain-containing protein [unclassified Anabaena]MTJ10135.1 rhodanese-like domain-containing protein [Anabaena sp. UHCC 0204]MTJ55611.1 rhodanese-like domain-containing protein [Anabaena sp. UHCC 0253]
MKIRLCLTVILSSLCIFIYAFFGVSYNSSAIASPLSPQQNILVASTNTDLQTTVDNYLKSIPGNYYTVGKVEELKQLLKQDNIFLVDVREPSEYASGHIGDAINIPLRTLVQNLDQIPKEQPVVVYCSSGYRSAMAVMSLHLLGYDNVRGFPPSMNGWKAAS